MPPPRCGPTKGHSAATAAAGRPGAQKLHFQARRGKPPPPDPGLLPPQERSAAPTPELSPPIGRCKRAGEGRGGGARRGRRPHRGSRHHHGGLKDRHSACQPSLKTPAAWQRRCVCRFISLFCAGRSTPLGARGHQGGGRGGAPTSPQRCTRCAAAQPRGDAPQPKAAGGRLATQLAAGIEARLARVWRPPPAADRRTVAPQPPRSSALDVEAVKREGATLGPVGWDGAVRSSAWQRSAARLFGLRGSTHHGSRQGVAAGVSGSNRHCRSTSGVSCEGQTGATSSQGKAQSSSWCAAERAAPFVGALVEAAHCCLAAASPQRRHDKAERGGVTAPRPSSCSHCEGQQRERAAHHKTGAGVSRAAPNHTDGAP